MSYLTIPATTQLERRLRRRLNPSDLVQETMLAAHRDFPAFRGTTERELIAWLRQILIHCLHRAIAVRLNAEKRDARREVSMDRLVIALDQSAVKLSHLVVATGPENKKQGLTLCR